jgi:serine/threonine protein kinase/tetratricopeptide (TPR) repeat protein
MPHSGQPPSGVNGCTLSGFELRPLAAIDSGAWWHGRHAASNTRVIVRRIDRVPFAEALHDVAMVIELQGASPPGIVSSLAVVVQDSAGRVVASAAADAAGFSVAGDAGAAATLAGDALVDVHVVYPELGADVLERTAEQPAEACAGLLAVTHALDGLAAEAPRQGRRLDAHGGLDWPCLRVTSEGAAVLGFGVDRLDAARRGRLDAADAWQAVAPERCLPPGDPTPRGDQYALAVLWVARRLGRSLFPELDAAAMVRGKLSGPPVLDGLPPAEREVIARALSGAVEERYGSCQDFVTALAAALGGSATPAGEGLAPETEESPCGADITTDLPADAPPEPSPDGMDPGATEPLPRSRASTVRMTDDPPLVPPEAAPVAALPARDVSPPQPVKPLRPVESTERSTASVSAVAPAVAPPSVALAAHPYALGDVILPGYRLVKQLGKGGFGEVWKATAPGGMSVAIKVIANLGRREGAREYRALQTVRDIRHAHIVPLFGVWLKTSAGRILDEREASDAERRILSTRDQAQRETIDTGGRAALENLELVLAMGLGECTLYDRFKRTAESGSPGLAVGHLLTWMRQAALAIDHFNQGARVSEAPGAAVQHCDIKPQNMLLVGDVVQVCDFGLARVQGEVRATANNLLSIAYAAPEMTVRPFDPSPTTDQYSLAVTYHELRTGRLPYPGHGGADSAEMSALEILKAKSEGFTEVRGLPPGETRVLKRALAREPDARFSSCAEFIDALEMAVERDAAPEPPQVVRPTTASASWLRTGILAGGVVLAAGLGTYVILPGRTAVRPEPVRPEPVRPEPVQAAGAAVPEQPVPAPVPAPPSVVPPPPPTPPPWLDTSREIEAAIAAASSRPTGVDDAVRRFDSSADGFPADVRDKLAHELSAALVDRTAGRLREADRMSAADYAGAAEMLDRSSIDARAAIRLDPNSWRAHDLAGRCDALRGRYADAIRAYTEAIESFEARPGDATDRLEIVSRRAYALLKQKRFAEAAQDYLVFRAGDRKLAANLWDIQQAAAEASDIRAATAVLELLNRLMDESPAGALGGPAAWEVRNTLAWYLACGPAADAASGRRAVTLATRSLDEVDAANRGQLLDSLAAAHARAGDFEAAIRCVDEARDVTDDPGLLDDLRRRREAFAAREPWSEP